MQQSHGWVGAARWSVGFALLACLMVPAGTTAQEPLGADLQERAGQLRAMFQERARIGVVLGEAQEVRGRTGVSVERVVEGGPAARAGVRAGDVLMALNDVDLGDRPGRRLTALMTEVDPGDTVSVRLHRNGRDETVRIVTDRSGATVLRLGEGVADEISRFDPAPVVARIREIAPALGLHGRDQLELVAMNPRLGRYFNAEEGVLVANVAPESTLGLEPGDVILSIGGRAVQDAAHARSILASYRGGEEVEIQVIRERRSMTVRGSTGTRPR